MYWIALPRATATKGIQIVQQKLVEMRGHEKLGYTNCKHPPDNVNLRTNVTKPKIIVLPLYIATTVGAAAAAATAATTSPALRVLSPFRDIQSRRSCGSPHTASHICPYSSNETTQRVNACSVSQVCRALGLYSASGLLAYVLGISRSYQSTPRKQKKSRSHPPHLGRAVPTRKH